MSNAFPTTAHWLDYLAGRRVDSARVEKPAAKSRGQVYSLTDHFRSAFWPTKPTEWYVATESFDVPGDPAGGFIAGRSYIAGDHELLKRWPSRFKRADMRTVDRVSRAQLDTAPQHVTQGHSQIALSPSAWAGLREDARRSEDGKETGGWLYGSRGDGLRIVRATSSDNAVRTSHSFQFNLSDRVDDEQNFEHLVRIGSWHTHVAARDGRPSRASLSSNGEPGDLEAWTAERAVLESNPDFPGDFIGIIVTRGANFGWLEPDLHAYILGTNGPKSRLLRCESARLEDY